MYMKAAHIKLYRKILVLIFCAAIIVHKSQMCPCGQSVEELIIFKATDNARY